MSVDRRMRLWTLLVEEADGSAVAVGHVGSLAVTTAGVDACAVTVVLAASPRENLYASSRLAADLEEITTTLGEGPGIDALAGGPALAGDLNDPHSRARWPTFAPAAVDYGVCAAFALPLQVGGIRLGVLDLYRAAAGALDSGQLADVLLLADTACALLLDTSAGRGADRSVEAARYGDQPEEAALHHPEVHQATGMIIAQIGVTAAVALVRLRAYAYTHDRRLRDVAADVVARRLRFHPDPTTTGDHGDS